MTASILFTDEDIYAAIAPTLRKAGLDAVSTPEMGRQGQSDEAQPSLVRHSRIIILTQTGIGISMCFPVASSVPSFAEMRNT